jgi:ABC-type dipeptide/oligopeptide/nickel transport system permease subunit
VLARLLVGVQHALLSALGGVLLAAVVGVAWGALAVLVARRLPGAGGPVAEVVLAPARLVTVAPLLLAGIILAGADRWPATLVVAVVVAPRVAAAVAELDRPVPFPVTTLLRTVGGLLLAAVGVAVAVLVGLGLLGLIAHPPTPSLGGVLSDSLPTLIGSDEGVYAAVVALLTTVPWLLAGSALLRHPRRPEALATLDS